MQFPDLNEDNYIIFASKNYDTPRCLSSEFLEDIQRIKYIKRLFKKYKNKKDLKENLILNHLIVFYNVFGPNAATRILFLKIDEADYDLLKTFLTYLSYMPDVVYGIDGENIISSNIPLNQELLDVLTKL